MYVQTDICDLSVENYYKSLCHLLLKNLICVDIVIHIIALYYIFQPHLDEIINIS